MKKIHIILLLLISFVNCKQDNPQENLRSIVYFNGDIITMEGNSPAYAEALVVKNKKNTICRFFRRSYEDCWK